MRSLVTDVIPIPKRELAEEVKGVIVGLATFAGKLSDSRDSLSATNCLLRKMLCDSSKIAVITERPGDD